jgi:hypothetical protein
MLTHAHIYARPTCPHMHCTPSHVCMHACSHVLMYMHAPRVHTWTIHNMPVYIHLYSHTFTLMCSHTCNTHQCVHTHSSVCSQTGTLMCTHTLTMSTHMNVHTHTCAHVLICPHRKADPHVHPYMPTFTHAHACLYVSTCICAPVSVHTPIGMFVNMHTHTCPNMHTRVLTHANLPPHPHTLYTCMLICPHMHTHVHTHVHDMLTYIHIHSYTHLCKTEEGNLSDSVEDY